MGAGLQPITRVKDGGEWTIGAAADVAWITAATTSGLEITAAIPPVFAAYCALELPERQQGAQSRHDAAVVAVLEQHTQRQPWWLGYLETGIGAETVFYDVPKVKLYFGWNYVLVRAGAEQALNWRESEGRWAWKGALPDLVFPADRSWLLSTLWDDQWSCIGGSDALVSGFAADPELGPRARIVTLGEDATPPGHAAR